jgi:hypothetical protein
VQQLSFVVQSLDDLWTFYHRIQDEGLRIDRTVTHGISYGWLNLTWEGFYYA